MQLITLRRSYMSSVRNKFESAFKKELIYQKL